MNINTTNYHTIKSLETIDIAILPWGATEPHNLHLPYGTDTILAERFATLAAQQAHREHQINAVVLPYVAFGSQNPGQWALPLCIHTRYETQRAILTDIVTSLSHQNINKLLIVNGHGGNSFKNMLRDLAYDFPLFTIVVSDWFAFVKQADFFENPDDHAGEMETSVMMHLFPELIDLSLAGSGESKPFALNTLREKIGWLPRNWSRVSSDTGIGNPRAATELKGEKCANWVTQKISQLIYELVSGDMY